MSDSNQDTITVSAGAEAEVAATHADLFVTVRGSSLFTGSAALKKAREVAQLVEGLIAIGISESEIELRRVQADVTTGALGNKVSSASYSLKIRCDSLSKLPDAIGVITSQKNTKLDTIGWLYGDEEENNLSVMEQALQRAIRKAQRIAATLQVKLIGIQSATTQSAQTDRERPPVFAAQDDMAFARARSSSMTAEDLGLEITHRKTITMSATVVYRISGFDAAKGE